MKQNEVLAELRQISALLKLIYEKLANPAISRPIGALNADDLHALTRRR